VAAESAICSIDGAAGKLYYRGYPIEDLAGHSSFEETTYLLLYESLPTAEALAEFSRRMRKGRAIAEPVRNMVRAFPEAGSPMELLQSVISYLSATVKHRIRHSDTCNCRRTLHQVAQLATVLAAYQRRREGKPFVEPRDDLSHGANFLYMLRGEAPSELEGRIMDACLILHAEHGFNASTFTARVVASTYATCYSSLSAAIGALSGFLHGGANERVLDMLDEIGTAANVGPWLEETIAAKRKVMGMGHRVYKARDPRAAVIEGFLQELSERKGESRAYDLLRELEHAFRARMEQQGKPIYANVDFYSGALYELLGIPRDLFTPVFAVARASGWLAHVLEQRKGNRLYRPKCLYAGPDPRPYAAVEERAAE
jgi:citrate synthase